MGISATVSLLNYKISDYKWCETVEINKLFLLCIFPSAHCGDIFIFSPLLHNFAMLWHDMKKMFHYYCIFFLYNRCRWGCSRILLKGLGLVVYNPGLSHLNTWPILGVSDYQCLWQKECVMDDLTLKYCFILCCLSTYISWLKNDFW